MNSDEQVNLLKSLDKDEVIKYFGLDAQKPDTGKPDGKYFDEAYVKELREEAKQHRIKKDELEKLLSEIQPKVTAYEVELKTLKTTKTELDTLKNEIKTELLSKLPEDKRESYKDFDITVLRKIVTDFVKQEKPADSPGTAGDRNPKVEKLWAEMTYEERQEMIASNPTKANALQAVYFQTYFKK